MEEQTKQKTELTAEQIIAINGASALYYKTTGIKIDTIPCEITPEMVNQLIVFLHERLTEREFNVIMKYFGLSGEKKLSFKKISEDFDVTAERIKQIRDKALRKLKYTSEWLYKWCFSSFETKILLDRLNALNDELSDFDIEAEAVHAEAERKIKAIRAETERKIKTLMNEKKVTDECPLRDSLKHELKERVKDIPKETLAIPIEDLHLGTHTYNSLSRADYHSLGDLVYMTRDDLMSISGIGEVSLCEIIHAFIEHNVPLRALRKK